MKGINNTLKVPPTSALILFHAKSLYDSILEQEYLKRIDFGDVKELLEKMSKAYDKFDKMVFYRKKYMREILKGIFARGYHFQVVSLGAGQDPLSLYLMEQFSSAIKNIFEVDIANMREKSKVYGQITSCHDLVHFIECDILNTQNLMGSLSAAGYDPSMPSIVIFEGIIHFITDASFLEIMKNYQTKDKHNIVIMDYTLADESIPPEALPGHQGCLGTVGEFVEGEFNTHTRKKMSNLISAANGEIFSIETMREIELKTIGYNKDFFEEGEGIEEMLAFRI